MKNVFNSFYRPDNNNILEIWKKCIFVPDTNVLLNLYRYPIDARSDLLNIFKLISDRLWIPFQVGFEYQQNRLQVIAEQKKKYGEVKDLVIDTKNKLKSEFDNLQLKKKHSKIDPDKFLNKLDNLVNEFINELEELEKIQPDVYNDDLIREDINTLFERKIGPPPQSQVELDEIYKEGKIRYENDIPPGFMDKGKVSGSYIYNGLIIKREFGDLLIWKQIINEFKDNQENKSIIFITDDEKEDWWWITNSSGKKTIGPRPELIQELSLFGINSFYIYNSFRFMEYAKTYLGISVKQESIQQVKDVSELEKLKRYKGNSFSLMEHQAVKAVKEWLILQNINNASISVHENMHSFPDLYIFDYIQEIKIGYEVKVANSIRNVEKQIKEAIARGNLELSNNKFESLFIVVVLFDETEINMIRKVLRRLQIEIPPKMSII